MANHSVGGASNRKRKVPWKKKIVARIVGILLLAMVTAGFFLVRHAGRKSLQAEAKGLLLGLHVAQAACLKELQHFCSTFQEIGFQPDGKVAYRVWISPRIASASPTTETPFLFAGGSRSEVTQDLAVLSRLQIHLRTNEKTFLAAAVGDIGGGALDVWTIDEHGILTNIQNGLP